MDPKLIQDKVLVFSQQLLTEAKGDPVQALGLLVLVLDGPEILSPDHAWRLIGEVRRILLPDLTGESPIPIQHLVGGVSWEGEQHCLRCGRILMKPLHEELFLAGYVFEIGSRLTSEQCEHYRACL
ncbi:MAG: hypothetical protein Nkreftii_003367 [Candidatus Nitrospira kreftii]|uniref:Uncharacterized protein n=1 Tax=Candidatus Nitrospira kreftii TaxID=2652173 RepID=A0A7S8FGS8_9BACT|nr:MAG: hypothetical protein Nkreftii_003367 [Candidatus Nitrospira kreftii]